MNARGYTLPEMAIVLTVILMLSSLLIVNYYNYQSAARDQTAARQIEQIKTAIVNYAAGRATEPLVLEVTNVDADVSPPLTVVARTEIPAGRPYLPCPDIDGDGREDRVPAPAASAAVSITVDMTVIYTPSTYPLENVGGCAGSRGAVPWRTLDTPDSDPWGNRYSYRVAGVFSNSRTGFDQHATGAARHAMRPFVSDAGVVRLSGILSFGDSSNTAAVDSGALNIILTNYLSPAVVCDDAPCPPIAGATISLVAGELAAVSSTLTFPRAADFDGAVEARLNVGDLISGIPFVVLSHGQNGYGAVRADSPGYVCNSFPSGNVAAAEFLAERQNAVWLAADLNSTDVNGVLHSCIMAGPGIQDAGFVGGDAGRRRDGYDDIVGWMSASELVAALSEKGALPARLLPPLGLEQ